jgi:hypothetical protein
MTISAAGFGRRISWGDDETPPGHKISFKRSVEILGSGLLLRMICPKRIFEWAPTKKIREARDGFAEFRVRPLDHALALSGRELIPCAQSYLVEMINERRFSNDKDDKRDLLSNLVDANEEFSDRGEQRLGEEELVGT